MSDPRVHVHLNWEADSDGGLSAYLSIARPDQEVERIPLTTGDVARLLADGAYLWSVVEPERQGPPRYNPSAEDDSEVAPHFIGVWGE